MGDDSSPTTSRPVVIISEPHQSYSLNSKFKVGVLNPFLYESETSYHISSINLHKRSIGKTYLELLSDIPHKILRLKKSKHKHYKFEERE